MSESSYLNHIHICVIQIMKTVFYFLFIPDKRNKKLINFFIFKKEMNNNILLSQSYNDDEPW